MQENRLKYCIQRMATVCEVSLSGYYDWLKRGMSKRKQHHNRCELLVKSAHMDTQQSYGHERLHQYLTSQGHDISLYMVRQIKQELVFTADVTSDLKRLLTQITTNLCIQTC